MFSCGEKRSTYDGKQEWPGVGVSESFAFERGLRRRIIVMMSFRRKAGFDWCGLWFRFLFIIAQLQGVTIPKPRDIVGLFISLPE